MADMISAETVTRIWQQMAQIPAHQAPQLVDHMRTEQPVILVYLLALDDFPFDQYEREIIFYMGLVVWQMMKQSKKRLRKVTHKKLRQVQDANDEFLSFLASDTEADFVSATRTMLENYREPEVLGYIIETLMEEEEFDPDNPPIRDEYRGLAFIHLKTVLDAFIASLAP